MAAPDRGLASEKEIEMSNRDENKPPLEKADISSDDDDAVRPQKTMTKAIWLACIALCLSYTTAFQQNSCTAAIVKHIDAELGPTHYYNWILSSYTISVSIALPLSGGLSDIFGRKPFFLVGTVISLTGTAIALGAQNVPMVITGMIFKGIGAGSQQLALAAIGELVPNKHRGNAQAVLDLVTLPWSIFGPVIGNAMVKYQRLSFRINFIVGIGLNILTMITIYYWYHPPPGRLPPGMSRMGALLQLDWVGVFFMALGVCLTLMGLAFGGVQFEWGSAGVIAPLTLGILSLVALGLWEWKGARHPFFAHALFVGKARTFTLQLLLTFVGGMSLYTAAAFWTQQCQGMFTRDPVEIGVSAMPGGLGGAVGGFLGGALIGRGPGLGSNHVLIYGSALKMTSDAVFTILTPNTFRLALGMGFVAMFGMGMSLVALIVCVQLASDDEHIGLATLVLGCIRAVGGSVAVTIYTSILQNTLKEDAGPRVRKALAPLGVSREALKELVPKLLTGKEVMQTNITTVTPEALLVAKDTVKWTWALAFRRIYFAAVAFSALSLVASFFVKDISHNMTDSVAVTLKNEREQDEKTTKRVYA